MPVFIMFELNLCLWFASGLRIHTSGASVDLLMLFSYVLMSSSRMLRIGELNVNIEYGLVANYYLSSCEFDGLLSLGTS